MITLLVLSWVMFFNQRKPCVKKTKILDVSGWVVQPIFRRYYTVSQLNLSIGFLINNVS